MKRNRASVAFTGIFSLVISASLAAAPMSALAASDSKFLDPFKSWPVPEAGETTKPETSAKPEATTDTAKPGKTDTSATTEAPGKAETAANAGAPAATAEPEVQIVTVEDLEALCRGGLTYGNSDASVLETDNLRIVASEGDVWVIQWGPGGVVTPGPAQKSASSTDAAPLDLGTLGVPELAAIRAAALASQLDGSLVENGDLTSAAKTAEELAAAKQEAPKDVAADATNKNSKAPEATSADAPKPPVVKTLTWIALDVWGNPGSAFVYEFEAANAADQTKSGDTTAAQPETKPAKQNAVAALIAADGRWSL